MNCDICFEPFDHSIHKPFNLSCPHTYCLSCIERLADNKCPECKKVIKEKYPSTSLLRLIPESNYDKLKSESVKGLIDLNEMKLSLKKMRQDSENKLVITKQSISNETNKKIEALKENEAILLKKCDVIHKYFIASLDSIMFENNVLFHNFISASVNKEQIERNELNEAQLTSLNNKISEIKQNHSLNGINFQIKNIENNYEFIPNNKSNDSLLIIGKIKLEKYDKVLEDLVKNSLFLEGANFNLPAYDSFTTELIECKSMITSPIVSNQPSPFTFAKKAFIRIFYCKQKRSYFLEIYLVGRKKCSISIELNDSLIVNFPNENSFNKSIIGIMSKYTNLCIKFKIEIAENYKLIENCLNKIIR